VYVRRRPGSLYQVTAGNSRPAIVKVVDDMSKDCDQREVREGKVDGEKVVKSVGKRQTLEGCEGESDAQG